MTKPLSILLILIISGCSFFLSGCKSQNLDFSKKYYERWDPIQLESVEEYYNIKLDNIYKIVFLEDMSYTDSLFSRYFKIRNKNQDSIFALNIITYGKKVIDVKKYLLFTYINFDKNNTKKDYFSSKNEFFHGRFITYKTDSKCIESKYLKYEKVKMDTVSGKFFYRDINPIDTTKFEYCE